MDQDKTANDELTLSCSTCKREKPTGQFHRSKTIARGYAHACKECLRQKNVAMIATRTPEQAEEYRAERRADYHANKQRRQERHKQWLADPKNAERALIKARQYKKTKRKEINAQKRERYANDPSKKVEALCRSRIVYVLNGVAKKSAPTLELIGCTFEQFRQHIEAQFLPGMTWANVGRESGTWQLDHIEPCCSFDLCDPAQQKQAFHYSNLQPLWYDDHKRKSAGDRRKCRKAA